MRRAFADTSWFIALVAEGDELHARAKGIAAEPLRLVTTAWVMSELAAYLSSPPNRSLFTSLLATVRSSSLVDFIPADQRLFDAGAALYGERADKDWSLVDCISFVVMKEQGLTDALSGDRHFE